MADATGRGPYTGKWYDERNKRRRDRYRKDSKYRRSANKAAREVYRKGVGAGEPFDPRTNGHMLDAGPTCVGRLRTVRGGSYDFPILTFTKAELAEVFQRPVKQIQQWAASNDRRIPSPVLRGRDEETERTWIDVYTQEEAKAIVRSLAPYLADLFYFRSDHKEAIEAVRAAVASVRKGMKL